jgi:tetratricopeptide (TPR) repeat protein
MSRFPLRFAAASAALLCLAAGFGPAGAQDRAPGVEPAPAAAPGPPALKDLPLDELFEKLANAAPNPAGRAIESEVLKRLADSGSETVDLLMRWAMQAIDEKKYAMALDLLDQALVLKPDFAEAWNKRATVNFLREDYAASLTDIRQTLALEPRHFGALSGLGIILQETGKKEEALVVFRKALEIDPLLQKVREAVEKLEAETAGSSI